MSSYFPKEGRWIFYIGISLCIAILLVALIHVAFGFDFATDEWDSTKYASPVAQWVAEQPPMDVHNINSVTDLATYMSQNNASMTMYTAPNGTTYLK